jgi:hypothetical protein
MELLYIQLSILVEEGVDRAMGESPVIILVGQCDHPTRSLPSFVSEQGANNDFFFFPFR